MAVAGFDHAVEFPQGIAVGQGEGLVADFVDDGLVVFVDEDDHLPLFR